LLAAGWDISVVISGGARGVDTLAETWARLHAKPRRGFQAPLAPWPKHAGAPPQPGDDFEVADAMIAIWDGASPWHVCTRFKHARKSGLDVIGLHSYPDW
jgi:hypothetical protein